MHPNEPLFLTHIGNLCRQWSYLEFLFAYAIWVLEGLEREAGIERTGNLDIGQLADRAFDLATAKGKPELASAIDAARTQMRKLAPERNRIVHGVYHLENGTMYLEHHRMRRAKEKIVPKEISDLGRNIAEISGPLKPAIDAAKS